jgi:microcin C transport system permease protein
MLIEKIFDIDGFGLLQFHSLLERDEPVIMGTLTVAALLMLVGNVISDIAVAIVDPKISFE